MLSITFVTVMMFTHHQATRDLAEENIWILFVALITVLVSIITLSCCEGVRRTSPTNLIFLAIFTVSESVLVGYSTLRYDRDTVRWQPTQLSIEHFENAFDYHPNLGDACSRCNSRGCHCVNRVCHANKMGLHNDGRCLIRWTLANDYVQFHPNVYA